MKGGYQILDLRNIDLTRASSLANIMDTDVLKQLLQIRSHIQNDYDFVKPLNNQLKPVLILYRDKKNGEKHESALFGSIEVATNLYTFKINAKGNGEELYIEVVFEEKTDDYSNKYWDIKTAKVLLSVNEAISGDASIGGDMSVTGDASIGGNLVVTGSINGETNPSVKPIYCHPVYLSVNKSSKQYAFTCLILNNDSTPFTKETFFNWCLDLFENYPTASVLASGYYGLLPCSRIKIHPVDPTSGLAIETPNNDGSDNDYWSLYAVDLTDASVVFADGVNKIN